MNEIPSPSSSIPRASKKLASPTWRVIKYLISRLVNIFLTIAVGVFLTVLVINRSEVLDYGVQRDIQIGVLSNVYSGASAEMSQEEIDQEIWQMEEDAGLHLPTLPRHLRWLYNALTFQWGEALSKGGDTLTHLQAFGGPEATRYRVTRIIVTRLPNTLLLVGTADLVVFLTGIPLALYLARRPNRWLDKLVTGLSSLASIPSWVHGIVLVMIFFVILHVLPYGKMFDMIPPATPLGYIPVVLKHMILPVTAILLSLFLQCLYTWRTFFLIYSEEDYVELAIAKGLKSRTIEQRYILRPTLPYIITSFALTLVSFWQMTTALEYFFDWPGIGQLYVEALAYYDLIVALGIVVIFAYFLGFVVLVLDVVYAIVDPRIRMGGNGQTVRAVTMRPRRSLRSLFARRPRPVLPPVPRPSFVTGEAHQSHAETSRARRETFARWRAFLAQLLRFPSAVVGLIIITGLVVMSVYALTNISLEVYKFSARPFWGSPTDVPINAKPAWVNWFLSRDLPPTIEMNSRQGMAEKEVQVNEDGTRHITITFTFEYPYGDFPQDVSLYFYAPYDTEESFVTVTWITPDGREIQLDNATVVTGENYNFSFHIPRRFLLSHGLYDQLRQISGQGLEGTGGYPAFYTLFASQDATTAEVLPGTYTVRVDGTTFEPGAEIDAVLALIGQVYGVAGTDNERGDLFIPLMWGAPVALAIGVLGALVTSIVSILVAAAGTWFGGPLDNLVQRITEASMILPFLAIGVLLFALFDVSLWVVIGIVVLLNAFGSPVKAYRAAFLQVKEAPYIEAARAYGARSGRIILRYMIPRILPMLIPQLVILIPGYIYLEATLAIFGVNGDWPTWGGLIYRALDKAVWQANYYWLAEPIGLLILTGLGFALLGSALDRMLNPRLKT